MEDQWIDYEWMNRWMDGLMGEGRMNGWNDRWMDGSGSIHG